MTGLHTRAASNIQILKLKGTLKARMPDTRWSSFDVWAFEPVVPVAGPETVTEQRVLNTHLNSPAKRMWRHKHTRR